ncbi:integron (plasmid) [Aureimonas ureilytica]|uniref:integron n=1 Tax=Aureimonas ureilytica TaxID=401562 RepID=UPI003CEF6EEC
MKLPLSLLAISVLMVCPLAVSASPQGAQPVEVGGDAELDACASLGRIVRLDPKGDNFLAVRDGPGSQRRELDRLGPGALVTICDERGAWLGIVYPAPGTRTDCGVSSPIEARSPYDGPCRSGWVHGRFVDVVAG